MHARRLASAVFLACAACTPWRQMQVHTPDEPVETSWDVAVDDALVGDLVGVDALDRCRELLTAGAASCSTPLQGKCLQLVVTDGRRWLSLHPPSCREPQAPVRSWFVVEPAGPRVVPFEPAASPPAPPAR